MAYTNEIQIPTAHEKRKRTAIDFLLLFFLIVVIGLLIWVIYFQIVENPQCVKDPLKYASEIANTSCFCSISPTYQISPNYP